MSTLFGGARARASDPSIPIPESALRLTTSVQGKARPIGWGRSRLGCNVIWIGDFEPYLVANYTPAQVTNTGGKGGGARTQQQGTITYTWNYLLNMLGSLCEGPIVGVVAVNQGNAWTSWGGVPASVISAPADIKNEFGAGNVLGPLLYATLFNGSQTQTPPGFMTTSHPAQALAYRGEAYIAFNPLVLGTSTSLPQMSFDVIFGHLCGLANFPFEAYPGDVLLDYFTNPEYGVPGYTTELIETPTIYNTFCGANSLLVSPVLTDQIEASQFVTDLLQATHSAIFMSGGVLRIRPYAEADASGNGITFTHDATPIYDLEPQDFLPGSNGADPIEISRKQPQEIVNNMRIEYFDRTNSYAATIFETRDEASIVAYGVERQSDVRTQHFFTSAVSASAAAALQLQREAVTTTYSFNLPREFELLDPMDKVTLPLDKYGKGQARQPALIIEIVENDDYSFTITAEEFLGTADMPIYDRQATTHNLPDFNAPAGDINDPMIFELPALLSGGLNIFTALSGQNPDVWGGAEVWASFDGDNYMMIDRFFGSARMGVTASALLAGAGRGPTADLSGTLDVDLTQSKGVLMSGSAADMIGMSTLCYLSGGELISYTLAELTGPFKYTITPLVRGGYGSDIVAHPIGAKFVRLDGSVAKVPYDQTRVGREIWLKFLSFNKYGGGGQTLGEVDPYTYIIGGTALAPEDAPPPALDDAAIKDFVDAVNADKEASAALTTANSASAKVTAVATTLADNTGAIASLETTVEANFGDLDARVKSLVTALANNQGTIASLATTVNAQGVSITNEQTAINSINGKMSARYSLELNVSGRITGFYLFADQSGRSDFAVQADKFQIWATGYPNKPVFEVGTIGGTADLVINGRNLGDLTALTDAIANNAVSNGAASSGTSGGDSGTASLTVRTGSRIVITANYVGGDSVNFLGVYTSGSLEVKYTPAGGSEITQTFQIPGFWYSSGGITVQLYFSTTVVVPLTAAASGTWQVHAHSYIPSLGRNLTSGQTTILIQEFKK